MKRFFFAAAMLAACTSVYAVDVGVSITIGQPGYYGRIDINGYPQPRILYAQPVIIERVQVRRPPIYLRVPPGHAKHWKKHCHEYNACGEQVYFVKDSWYSREYVPRYQEYQRDRNYHDNDHDNYRGNGNDHNNDHGKGHGNGHGNGH
ncbi:MAG: hypothetical protein B7Y40_03910 [Gammaproteobacteria bacterium 28-57-27]|nr:MAG: hypothetical protein B7Y40_03910 [Gammaproteobacteria bacterium 28-57-27]